MKRLDATEFVVSETIVFAKTIAFLEFQKLHYLFFFCLNHDFAHEWFYLILRFLEYAKSLRIFVLSRR